MSGSNRIVFNLAAPPPTELDEERDKHQKRADRFQTSYLDPLKTRSELSHHKKLRPGFKTGFDLFAEDEIQKKEERASRFGVNVASQYQPDKEVEARIRRAEKFGVEIRADDANSGAFASVRWEAPRETARRPEAIYMYGTDRMSVNEVLNYWGNYAPVSVERLDASSCVVVFEDAETVKRAIAGRGKPVPQACTAADLSSSLDLLLDLPFLWHRGAPPEVHPRATGGNRRRQSSAAPTVVTYRMATVDDVPSKAPKEEFRSGGRTRRRDYADNDTGDYDTGDYDMGDAKTSSGFSRRQGPPPEYVNLDEPQLFDPLAKIERRLAAEAPAVRSRKLARRHEGAGGIRIQDRKEMDEREAVMGSDDGEIEEGELEEGEFEENGVEEGQKLSSGITITGLKKRARGQRGGRVVRLRKLRQVQGARPRGGPVSKYASHDEYADLEDEDAHAEALSNFALTGEGEDVEESYGREVLEETQYLGGGGGKMGDESLVETAPAPSSAPTLSADVDIRAILDMNREFRERHEEFELLDLLT